MNRIFQSILVNLQLIILIGAFSVKAQSHYISFSAGYSLPIEKKGDIRSYSRNDLGTDANGQVVYEDITPKFMQGVDLALGYDYYFSKHWSLWADMDYVNSKGYEVVNNSIKLWPTDIMDGIHLHQIDNQNFALNTGLALSLGREDRYYYNSFSKRFYYQLRAGISYNKPVIKTTSNPTPDSQFDVRAKSTLKGYGLGAKAGLRSAFQCSSELDVFLQFDIERLTYKATGIVYKEKSFNNIDVLNPSMNSSRTKEAREVDFPYPYKIYANHFSIMLGLSYSLGKN